MSLRVPVIVALLFIQTITNVRAQLNDDFWYESMFLYKIWPENLESGASGKNLDEGVVVELIKDVDYIEDFVEIGYINEEPVTTQVPEEKAEPSTTATIMESDASASLSAALDADVTMETQNATSESTTNAVNVATTSEDVTTKAEDAKNVATTSEDVTTNAEDAKKDLSATVQAIAATSVDTLSAIPLPEMPSTECPSLASNQKTISLLLILALVTLLQKM